MLRLAMHLTQCLECADVIHSDCLVSHVKSFPPQTAPAGYVCPACSTPVCSAYGNTWNVQLHTLAFSAFLFDNVMVIQ